MIWSHNQLRNQDEIGREERETTNIGDSHEGEGLGTPCQLYVRELHTFKRGLIILKNFSEFWLLFL